jgi:Rieske Fe-S protein
MPLDEDKYPTQTGRRRFVKGVVGSASLAGVSAGAAASLNAATSSTGAGGGTTQYIGIENTAGPAPRGMPVIPMEVTSEGELRGVWPEPEEVESGGRTITVAQQDIGGTQYSSTWFQYCGVQQYRGTQPAADADNMFNVKPQTYDWIQELEADRPLRVDDFSDYETWGNGIGRSGLGKPAVANWRATDGGRPLPVQILRSTEVPKLANGEGKYSELPGPVIDFMAEAVAGDDNTFMAWLSKCTHFCCVPGFKTSTFENADNQVYCQCHQSTYDPFNPVPLQFVALPRPK